MLDTTETPQPANTAPPPTPHAEVALREALQVVTQLNQAMLDEQRSSRRWRNLFRVGLLGVLLLISAAIFIGVSSWSTLSHHSAVVESKHIALVRLDGEIDAETDNNAETINAALLDAFQSSDSVAVFIHINSPGGSPVQADLINHQIQRLKLQYSKPVYAIVDDLCASGAYFVAVAADQIFVNRSSLIGSIGVIMEGFGFDKTMQRYGIERRVITAGRDKNQLDPYAPIKPHDQQQAQIMLDEVHQHFIDVVKQGRGNRLSKNPDLFSGQVWNGRKSIELGLADAEGDLTSVANDIVHTEDIIDYTQRLSLPERLAERFGVSLGRTVAKVLGGYRLR